MSDDTRTEAEEASAEHDANAAPVEEAGNPTESGSTTTGAQAGAAKPTGGTAKRRRRRGSRGGRNRRKRKPAAAPRSDGAENKDTSAEGEDYSDSTADRGMTTEDVTA